MKNRIENLFTKNNDAFFRPDYLTINVPSKNDQKKIENTVQIYYLIYTIFTVLSCLCSGTKSSFILMIVCMFINTFIYFNDYLHFSYFIQIENKRKNL